MLQTWAIDLTISIVLVLGRRLGFTNKTPHFELAQFSSLLQSNYGLISIFIVSICLDMNAYLFGQTPTLI